MSHNVPKHMHTLSEVYWEIVDALIKNNFPEAEARDIATSFFKQFSPFPRESVKKKKPVLLTSVFHTGKDGEKKLEEKKDEVQS